MLVSIIFDLLAKIKYFDEKSQINKGTQLYLHNMGKKISSRLVRAGGIENPGTGFF